MTNKKSLKKRSVVKRSMRGGGGSGGTTQVDKPPQDQKRTKTIQQKIKQINNKILKDYMKKIP